MSKKQTKKIIRILFIIASITSLFFVPWILVWAWILPLPDTVQEQVNEAIDHGFDGMIVYVDEAGKPPAFYTAATSGPGRCRCRSRPCTTARRHRPP